MKTDKIVIVGGGSAGWMTAATLIKAFPNKDISVIESPDIPTVGVGESTLGKIRRWTRFLEIDEKDFMAFTNGTYKLSIRFTDFKKKGAGSFHYPFGSPSVPEHDDATAIREWHAMREYYPELGDNDMVNNLFSASVLWENNKFHDNFDGSLDNFFPHRDVAYHFDAARFGLWLRDTYCLPRGVKHIPKSVSDIDLDDNGITQLVMADGESITADLFVDCTGFRSMLLGGALEEPFVSYSDILPNDSAWATQLPYIDRDEELTLYTDCTAINNGWVWNIPLWTRLGTGYVYSSKYISDDRALNEFKEHLCSDYMVIPRTRQELEQLEFRKLKMRVGIHERIFVKNVVAIGLSAGFIEPLESNGLLSVHEFLFTLVDVLQREHVTSLDRKWFNIECRDFFDGFAKFVASHYAMSQRDDTPYWRDCMTRNYSEHREGEEYETSISRISPFFAAQRSFFDGPYQLHAVDGFDFISTGMGYRVFGGHRKAENEYLNGWGTDLKHRYARLRDAIAAKNRQWDEAAESFPTITEYLQNHIYDQ